MAIVSMYNQVAINGLKGPNNRGRDVFVFYITSAKSPLLYPAGGFYISDNDTGTLTSGGSNYWNYNGTTNGCSSANKDGQFCAGRIMEKGWVMDY